MVRELDGAVSFREGTLPETNIVPEKYWLEDDPFLLGGRSIFRGELWGFCCLLGLQGG